jgi:hypothetical protein
MGKPDIVAAESARRELFTQAGDTSNAGREELRAIIDEYEQSE